jgi:hypothetical protein
MGYRKYSGIIGADLSSHKGSYGCDMPLVARKLAYGVRATHCDGNARAVFARKPMLAKFMLICGILLAERRAVALIKSDDVQSQSLGGRALAGVC